MVRISDARMSGTAYGTIVLHVSPEAAVGGPLALVRNGDRIRLSVKERQHRPAGRRSGAAEAQERPGSRRSTTPTRGYAKLYMDHVLQAEHGCDFDFLQKSLATSSAGYSYFRSKLRVAAAWSSVALVQPRSLSGWCSRRSISLTGGRRGSQGGNGSHAGRPACVTR